VTSEHNRAKLFELLIQELQDFAVFLVDLDGTITSWNPGVERFLGYTEQDFVGRPFRDIFTPEDRQAGAHKREIENARTKGRSSDIRWHLCSDESRVFVEGVLTAIKDETGSICGFSKIARAVRPRQAAGTMLGAILEGTDDPIYAIDKSGSFVFANTAAARLFERNLNDLIGRTREQVLGAGVAANLRATDESVMRDGHPRLIEERFPAANREERVLLATKAPWRDADGGVIGLVATAKDITTRIAHQNERERLLRDVRRSNEALGDFSHVVAHDLRAPLRAVRTYTELLAQHLESSLDPASRQFMNFVIDGSERMEKLIESLLRYAESGNNLSLSRINLNAIVEGLRHSLEPLIRESGAVITSDTLPDLQADPVRILQLFQNLIVNAIHYRDLEAPRIHIASSLAGDEYRFSISDNGIGIAPEHFETIFAPLTRLHSKDVPGSGIGLALCRKIVERHGGRIWVQSAAGQGATFFFTLPANASARSE